MLQRKPAPPLYGPLEAVAGIASTVSVKAHKNVAVAVKRLKVLDRLHRETGNTLRNSVSRGLTGAAAEEVKNIAEQECKYLEFYLQPVKAELQKLIDEARPYLMPYAGIGISELPRPTSPLVPSADAERHHSDTDGRHQEIRDPVCERLCMALTQGAISLKNREAALPDGPSRPRRSGGLR